MKAVSMQILVGAVVSWLISVQILNRLTESHHPGETAYSAPQHPIEPTEPPLVVVVARYIQGHQFAEFVTDILQLGMESNWVGYIAFTSINMWMNSRVGFRRSMSFVDAMWSLILFI
jgi:hypothetical protein